MVSIDTNLVGSEEFERQSTLRKQAQIKGSFPEWFITQGFMLFNHSYQYKDEDGFKGRIKTIVNALKGYLPNHEDWAEKEFTRILWKGFNSLSTPALANTGTDRGMNVACSGQYVGDEVYEFYNKLKETAMLSKLGFGTSADFSSIRSRGSLFGYDGKANGASEVIDDFFTCTSKISQGSQRRGAFAAYIDIEHGDFIEAIHNLKVDPDGRNYGWTIRDSFIEKLKSGDLEALSRWNEALAVKLMIGKGFFFFVDKANRHRPQMYGDLDLDVKATNLCTEIMLHSSEDYTYSCILSSMNLVHWDTLKDDDSIFVATILLDCMVSYFIDKSEGVKGLENIRAFTMKGRAIGLGAMGFHTYLQSKGIAYGSLEATYLANDMAKRIHEESLRASQWLAEHYGEPDWCKGYGVRNTHRIAYAPTKSTSLIMGGVSESWSPYVGMVYDQPSLVGELRRIPQHFYNLMKARGKYNRETIDSIINNIGSIKHLDWLTEEEKLIFSNAYEVNQEIILTRASSRQKYTCQGQSLNFYIASDNSEAVISRLLTMCALDENILSQYYIYSRNEVAIQDECVACSA